jgi:hypothetical protein
MRALLAAPVIGLVLTACGHASSSQGPAPVGENVVACCAAPSDAHVSGVLMGIGGPAGADPQHWAGTIEVSGRVFTTIRTDSRGHFSRRLPAGTYRFNATSPSYDDGQVLCRAATPVRLVAHRTTHVRVICQLK